MKNYTMFSIGSTRDCEHPARAGERLAVSPQVTTVENISVNARSAPAVSTQVESWPKAGQRGL